MLIVISNPTPIEKEHTYINSLFDAGAPLFHLRKPDYSLNELQRIIQKIDKQHRSKIVLHQHYELAADYNINRFHFPEVVRLERDKTRCFKQTLTKKFSEKRTCLSTSIHDTTTYASLTADFAYCFISPLFNSISKHGDHSLLSSGFIFPKKRATKLIALGGICSATIEKTKFYLFDGIAVLGAIWETPKNAVSNYKKINQQWQN